MLLWYCKEGFSHLLVESFIRPHTSQKDANPTDVYSRFVYEANSVHIYTHANIQEAFFDDSDDFQPKMCFKKCVFSRLETMMAPKRSLNLCHPRFSLSSYVSSFHSSTSIRRHCRARLFPLLCLFVSRCLQRRRLISVVVCFSPTG